MGNGVKAHKREESVGGVVIVIYTDVHVVLLKEPWRDNPKQKCAGGGINPGEDPVKAARRELKQETGIYIPLDNFFELLPPQGPYGKHYFFVHTTERQIRSHAEVGDDGGVVQIVRRDAVGQIPDMLAEHELLIRLIPFIETLRTSTK